MDAAVSTDHNVSLQTLPIHELRAHPDNPRVVMRDDVVDGIKAQIEQNGFSPAHAILTRPIDDGYQIVSGHHRVEAAKRAGLIEVPSFVQDMTDDEAFMQLVLANSQGELSPLELGMHVRRYVQAAKGGTLKGGEKARGGISHYASVVGGDESKWRQRRDAAEVYEKVCFGDISEAESVRDKPSHLTYIHDAPREAWPALVQMVVNESATVARVKDKAKRLKALFDAIPDWWRGQLDHEALAQTALENDKTADRRKRAFEAAAEIANSLGTVTIYEHADTGERREVDGREYEVHRAEGRDFDARAAFIDKVLSRKDAPDADAVRKIKRDLDRYISDNGSGADKLVAVETEEEYRQRIEREAEEERERERQAIRDNIYEGDCRDALRSWQGEKIRLLMTDPPYGMGFQSNRRIASDKADKIAADDSRESATTLLSAALSAAKPQLADEAHIVVFCHDDSFQQTRQTIEDAGFTFKRMLVWVKPNHTSGDLYGSFAPRKELAVHAVCGKPDVSPRKDDVYIQEHENKEGTHPTEKPVEMLKYFMESLTDEGDLVADPFAGTGATLVAAIDLGRAWWGAELDVDYRQVAAERAVEAANV